FSESETTIAFPDRRMQMKFGLSPFRKMELPGANRFDFLLRASLDSLSGESPLKTSSALIPQSRVGAVFVFSLNTIVAAPELPRIRMFSNITLAK
ncbi:MAG TPA: hypothetical protein DEA22_14950, partial [Blastocatellia bacterium]|nr:hypothetical protein [Blastocatellia bacterium]